MSVVACLGDSITEGSPYWDSRRRSGDPEGQWQHWAGRMHPELEFRNHGIWGECTDEIARRFDVAVAGADRLLVQGGSFPSVLDPAGLPSRRWHSSPHAASPRASARG